MIQEQGFTRAGDGNSNFIMIFLRKLYTINYNTVKIHQRYYTVIISYYDIHDSQSNLLYIFFSILL